VAGERSLIARHAGTVLVGQLAVMAFGVTDTIIAGRYSEHALAALSVGAAVFVSVYVSLMGVLQALLPSGPSCTAAAAAPRWAARCASRCTWRASPSWPAWRCCCRRARCCGWTQVPPEMRGEVEAYLVVLAFGLAPALLFRLFSTLNQSLGKPQLVTWLQLGSLFVKLPLSVWFTFGGAGLPAMGLVGCGWATLCVNWAMLGCAPSGCCAAALSTAATGCGSASSRPTGTRSASSRGWACPAASRCWSR
jgi:MATE family multidrug resistance protein